MTPKQRFISAMRFRQPDDKVAMMEIEFQIHDEYVGEPLVVGQAFQKLSRAEKDRALARNAEVMIMTAEKAGHDVIRDIGAYWEVSPGEPAMMWMADEADRLEQIRQVKKLAGDTYFLQCFPIGFIGIPSGDRFEAFVDQLFEDPHGLHAQLKERLEAGLQAQNRCLDAGADGVGTCTDVAFNTGTFLSPAQMDEFFFPYFNRWADQCKRDGLISIWHTDGNLTGILDRIVASGVTAIQCVDPLGAMDIAALKTQLDGSLALIGNMDCGLLQFGPPDAIDAAAKAITEPCKVGGGFALGGCNSIFKGIPAHHYQAFADARNKYGTYR